VHRAKTLNLICWLGLLLALAGCEPKSHLVEQHLLEFGTIITITLITDDLPEAERILTEIEHRLRSYRSQWHAWEDSDLTRFNRALAESGRARIPVSLSPILRLSQHYHEATGGLFNPALGKLIAAHGFHGDDEDRKLIAAIKSDMPDMRDLSIDGDIAGSRNRHLQIDLGGIAKGYALALMADYLEQNGIANYLLDAGGDLQISGNRFGRPWRVGIQNPFAPGAIGIIELEGKHSLFTSGNYQRQYRRGGQLRHHIIDPRSGESSQGQSSATVLCEDAVLGDVAATALMIDGMQAQTELPKALQIRDFLLISDDKEIITSRSFADKLEITVAWPIKIVN